MFSRSLPLTHIVIDCQIRILLLPTFPFCFWVNSVFLSLFVSKTFQRERKIISEWVRSKTIPIPRWRNHNLFYWWIWQHQTWIQSIIMLKWTNHPNFGSSTFFCFVFVSVFMGVCVFFIRPSVGEGISLEFVSFNSIISLTLVIVINKKLHISHYYYSHQEKILLPKTNWNGKLRSRVQRQRYVDEQKSRD